MPSYFIIPLYQKNRILWFETVKTVGDLLKMNLAKKGKWSTNAKKCTFIFILEEKRNICYMFIVRSK